MRGRTMYATPGQAGRGFAISGNAGDGRKRPGPQTGYERQTFLSQSASTSQPHLPTDGEQLSVLLLAIRKPQGMIPVNRISDLTLCF